MTNVCLFVLDSMRRKRHKTGIRARKEQTSQISWVKEVGAVGPPPQTTNYILVNKSLDDYSDPP